MSFLDYVKSVKKSKDSTDGMTFSMKAAELQAKALNLALSLAIGALIGFAVSTVVKTFTEFTNRFETAATKTKEAADAATDTTASVKELVDAYKELGDRSEWDSSDFEQAKDIQDQLLDLAKEQSSLDQDRVDALDLQNGKYKDQLELLDKLTMKQLEAASYDLITSKDAQGEKLVHTGKDQNRTHLLTILNSDEMSMADNIRDSGIDIENSLGGFGADNWNDPDSIVAYYNNIGDALKYVIDNTTEAERKAGGAYHNLYQFLVDEQNALKDDVDNYNDSTDAIKDNANARAKLAAVILMSGQMNSENGSYSDYEKINGALETLKSTIDGFDSTKLSELLWGTNDGLTDEQVDALTVLRKAITDMDFSSDTDGANAFIQALVQLGMVSLNATDGLTGLQQAAQDMEEISKEIDNLQSAYKACSTAMEEYNKYGYMSADSLQSLLSMDTQYLSCLDLVDGKLQINKQRYAELLAAQYAQAEVTAIQQATEELKAIQDEATKEKVEGLTTATEEQQTAMENAIPAIKDTTVATGDLAIALATAQGAAGDDEALNARINAVTTALNTKLAAIHANTQAAINSGTALANQLNGFPTDKKSKQASKSVTDIASAFDTLTKAMKEYNQYGYICADTMKSLIGVDDKFTACLTEQNGKLRINTATFRTFIKAQLEEANASKDGGKSANEMKRILDWLNSSVDSETISFEQLTDVIKGYGSAMDEALEKTNTIKSAFSDLHDVLQKLSGSQFGIGDADSVDKQAEAIRNLVTQYKDYPELLRNIVDENGNISLNTDAFKNALVDALEGMANTALETGGEGAQALYNTYHNASQNISQGKITPTDYMVGLGTDLSNANDVLDRYQSNWNTLKDAMDEWNTTGKLTQDTMQSLMEMQEEFSSLLQYDENGNAKIDVKVLRDNYVEQLKALAEEFKGKPIGIQAEAMIEDVREPTPEEYEALAKKTLSYQKALAKYTAKVAKIDGNKNLIEDEALQQKAEAQAELDGALQESLKEVQETDAQVTQKLKEHWDGAEKVIEEFKDALNDLKSVFSDLLSLIEKLNNNQSNDLKLWGDVMGDVIDKRIDALNKQKEALEENNDATERAIELAKAQDELARAEQQRTNRVYTENGYEWQADPEAVRSAREDLNDKQRQWNKEDAEKAIDDQIKKYNEFKDKLSEVMEDIGTNWDDYNKKLQYTAQIQAMTLGQMEDSLDRYHDKIIASIKNDGVVSNIQTVISNLESLIGTLEKLNNVYTFLRDGTYTDGGLSGLLNTVSKLFNKEGRTNIKLSFGKITDNIKGLFKSSTSEVADVAVDGATQVATQVATEMNSSGGLVGVFQNVWNAIKNGATNLFSGSSGLVSTIANGAKQLASGAGSILGKIGTTIGGGSSLLTGVALAGVALAGNSIAQGVKRQKEIKSSDDSTGVKVAKTIGNVLWTVTPACMVVDGVKTIGGWLKKIFKKTDETADNTKDTADSSAATAENTKISGINNITANATKGTLDSANASKKQAEIDAENQKKENVKTAVGTGVGTAAGAAAGFAIGGPIGALAGGGLGALLGWLTMRHADGLEYTKKPHLANIDEQGPEMLVRKPQVGRYTYLETGDGVVPADITSRLFEMGGNPDKWFTDQMAKHNNAAMVQPRSSGGISMTIGDVNVNNPVGDSDALARQIVQQLPNKMVQQLNKR